MTALLWDGCVNVRDLGGLPTADGRTTRRGQIVRADNVRRLSEAGWRALVAHGVSRVVDLRFAGELEADDAADAPVEVVHVSLLGEWDDATGARYEQQTAGADATARLVWLYLEFLDSFRANFAAAIGAVADAPEGAVVVHCMAGKDRTGLVSALLLRLAGVETAVVAADYALSEANLAPANAGWIAEAEGDEAEMRRRQEMLVTPATAMAQVLDTLEERHGAVEAYLVGCGLPREAIARLRARLLDGD
jgi:protein tyrosine/serine phosphatase